MGKVTNPDVIVRKDARRRARLPEDQPILGARCPEAQARLFDFSVQLRERLPFSTEGLLEACETILACVQDEYRERASPLEPVAAIELSAARKWAMHAVALRTGSYVHARRFEITHTHGEPLTLCVGTQVTVKSDYWEDVLEIPARGCYSIIEESRTIGGRRKLWCDEHAPNKGQRARARAREHKRFVDEIAAQRLTQ
jgi:hypothetical protein